MKLNIKRTTLVGLAFLSICAFWQMYDNVVPLILKQTFHMNETLAGVIMGADNVLALFLLPFFGTLSDRTNTKIGKRMPFIIFGSAAAIILMNLLPFLDNSYAAVPANGKIVVFVILLGLLLIAMGTYRSPAVALMPDVTPKPLRSKANAIINLMGAVGGIIYLGITSVMYPNSKTQVKSLIGWGRVDNLYYDPNWKDVEAQPVVPPERPYGEWNDLELICAGDTAEYILNGKTVLKIFDLAPSAGRIQLQSECHTIEYRNITIEPIAAK